MNADLSSELYDQMPTTWTLGQTIRRKDGTDADLECDPEDWNTCGNGCRCSNPREFEDAILEAVEAGSSLRGFTPPEYRFVNFGSRH